MYKVTAYFKDHKVAQKFYDLYDAIDYRDSADANYPIKVTFEKVKDMREYILRVCACVCARARVCVCDLVSRCAVRRQP